MTKPFWRQIFFCMTREAPEISQTQEPVISPDLAYAVQPWLVTSCITEYQWYSLTPKARRSLMNAAFGIDKYFMDRTLPPGNPTTKWTRGEKMAFSGQILYCQSHGVDPTKHWSLFSLVLPKKTGSQCRKLYERFPKLAHIQETAYAAHQYRLRQFQIVCKFVLGEDPWTQTEGQPPDPSQQNPCTSP